MEGFHCEMVNYLLEIGNIFKYNWIDFWTSFAESFDFKISGEDFRSEMTQNVLPKIKTFDLTEQQKEYLKILRYDMFLKEHEDGFTVIVTKNESERIKIILTHLESRKTVQFFNGQDLNEFSKRPDLLLWFSLLLKRDEVVLGKIMNPKEMVNVFRKKREEKSEITADLNDILYDLKCAEQCQKYFLEFLNEEEEEENDYSTNVINDFLDKEENETTNSNKKQQ
ncbi:hypothetical protein ACFFRR_000143 [Megaselia abdita]